MEKKINSEQAAVAKQDEEIQFLHDLNKQLLADQKSSMGKEVIDKRLDEEHTRFERLKGEKQKRIAALQKEVEELMLELQPDPAPGSDAPEVKSTATTTAATTGGTTTVSAGFKSKTKAKAKAATTGECLSASSSSSTACSVSCSSGPALTDVSALTHRSSCPVTDIVAEAPPEPKNFH